MFRAISQIVSVTRFSLASLPQRLGSSASAMFGIAGVVAVMVGGDSAIPPEATGTAPGGSGFLHHLEISPG